jgi:ABC-type transport system involved in Fe-S cluster assembly, permease component
MAVILEERDMNVARYESLAASLSDGQPEAIHALRREGLRNFSQLGFPTTRHELWRYTSVAPIARTTFELAAPATIDLRSYGHVMIDNAAAQLVFVNGRFARELSFNHAGNGVNVASLADSYSNPVVLRHLGRLADSRTRHFVALNTSLLNDGAFVRVAAGVQLAAPIHLLFVSTNNVVPQISTCETSSSPVRTHS